MKNFISKTKNRKVSWAHEDGGIIICEETAYVPSGMTNRRDTGRLIECGATVKQDALRRNWTWRADLATCKKCIQKYQEKTK